MFYAHHATDESGPLSNVPGERDSSMFRESDVHQRGRHAPQEWANNPNSHHAVQSNGGGVDSLSADPKKALTRGAAAVADAFMPAADVSTWWRQVRLAEDGRLNLKRLHELFVDNVFVVFGELARDACLHSGPCCSCLPFAMYGDCEHVAVAQSLGLVALPATVSPQQPVKRARPKAKGGPARRGGGSVRARAAGIVAPQHPTKRGAVASDRRERLLSRVLASRHAALISHVAKRLRGCCFGGSP